jgi:4-alpha-glucanotransferase
LSLFEVGSVVKKKASGLLLHISSLPSRYGIGDFGPEAYRFVDFLVQAKQRYWQILPFSPLSSKNHYSPYDGLSAFAGNPLFISPEQLFIQGFLGRKDLQNIPALPTTQVDYTKVSHFKSKLFGAAFEKFEGMQKKDHYNQFCEENRQWLEDFAIFVALRRHFQTRLWCNWPEEIRNRKNCVLKSSNPALRRNIEREKFLQYIFFTQWFSLRSYCQQYGVRIIGDIPIYVSYNSADIWAHPELFKLNKSKKPMFMAGVPPDFFSRTGQLWGNPLYDWKTLRSTGYQWWVQRVKHNLRLFDMVRIDHFRGFVAYWQVPTNSKTAVAGKWIKGPGADFFNSLLKHISSKRIIVENLGYITPNVRRIMEKFKFIDTRVIQFGFERDKSKNPHFIDNYVPESIVYTGTHDNNTVVGWFEKEATDAQKQRIFDYLGHKVRVNRIHWELIKLAMSSAANIVIIQMQDILGLGQEARMNQPASVTGNWRWRLEPRQIKNSISEQLAKITEVYGRVYENVT